MIGINLNQDLFLVEQHLQRLRQEAEWERLVTSVQPRRGNTSWDWATLGQDMAASFSAEILLATLLAFRLFGRS